MAAAELKTKRTEQSVDSFLSSIAEESVREDSKKIASLMAAATGAPPKMWGANIVGFGEKLLKYESGRELDWLEIGFSPRKANLTLYLNAVGDWNENLLSKLGKHKLGKGCLYIKRLSDVNEDVLAELIAGSVENIRKY